MLHLKQEEKMRHSKMLKHLKRKRKLAKPSSDLEKLPKIRGMGKMVKKVQDKIMNDPRLG